jgi:hypothetical protein
MMQVSILPLLLLLQVVLLHVLEGVETFSVRSPTAVTGPRWTLSQSTGDVFTLRVNVNPRGIVPVVHVRTSVGVVAAAARPSPEEDTENVEDGMIGKEKDSDSDDLGKFEMATGMIALELELEPGDDETEDSTKKTPLSALPPLPEYLNRMEQEGDSSDSYEEGPPQRKKKLLKQSSSLQQDETNRKIEEQQRQIDLLMQLVQKSNSNSNSNSDNTNNDKTIPKYENNPSSSAETETNVIQDSSEQTNQEDEVGEMEQEDQPHWFLSTDAFQQEEEAFFATTATNSPSPSNVYSVAPLKAMMFIDGTWLYYSLHERKENQCPIIRKFGRGWQKYYKFDWYVQYFRTSILLDLTLAAKTMHLYFQTNTKACLYRLSPHLV